MNQCTDTIASIGTRIAAMRRERGMTQEELGARVGVTGQAVSKWENGGVPDTYLIPMLARVLETTTDALFGMQKTAADRSREEVLAGISDFCRARYTTREGRRELFDFLFDLVWHVQYAAQGGEACPDLAQVIERYRGNPQITSQIIRDEGTTYLSLVEGFPLFCAVRDTPEIAEKLRTEREFYNLFSLLGDPDGLAAVILTQSMTESGLYTAHSMAERLGMEETKFQQMIPALVRYGLLSEDSLTLDGEVLPVYHKWSNPEVRMILMMAYQFIHARQCYYNFTCERTQPYF